MRIAIDELSTRGLTVRFSREDDWAREAVAVALDGPVTALEGSLRVERAKRGVKTTVEGRAVVEHTCDRCGALIALPVKADEELLFLPEEEPSDRPDRPDGEIEADDLDVGWYQGDELDLGQVTCEAFALNLPMRITCAVAEVDDVALAEAACTARMAPSEAGDDQVGSPFAVLSKLR
ncbi:MAG TPA: DUF177 domain-containing protein [Myxococcota bacterium]|nr:DUF177 domain-containing protein [Myxococcota bacterium]